MQVGRPRPLATHYEGVGVKCEAARVHRVQGVTISVVEVM